MGYYIFLFLFVIPVILLILIFTVPKAHHEKKLQEWHSQNIEYELHIRHVGGHPYIPAGARVYIRVNQDKTIEFLDNNKKVLNTIKASQITACEMKDETQIQSRITATRLVAFGIFAAAAPKKTTTHSYYLILSYTQNGVNVDCLFNHELEFGNFISVVNKVRIEST